jgi:3-hydroxy acid dehydrogenase/malonic semialdehyde reductase
MITGGGRGIGLAIARRLLDDGAKVFDLSRRSRLVEQIEYENAYSFNGDVANEADVAEAFDQCRRHFGPIDILINNAGLGLATPNLAEVNSEDFDHMFQVNVRGVFLCAREALKDMLPRQSGHIMTVISMAGQRTNAVAPLYVASKFGARGFNGALADQVIAKGIKVTDLNPGPVDSDYWGERLVPREKFLSTDDVAQVAHFVLALPEHVLIREINFDNMKWLMK